MNTLPILMENEQSLENNALFEKTMTTKEVAEVLRVSPDTVTNAIHKLGETSENFRKFSKGQTPRWNEVEVTAIKKELESHSKVNELSPMTELEIDLFVEKALLLQQNKIKELRAENKALHTTIEEQKPAVDFYKTVTGSSDTFDMKTVSKVLNKDIGRNKLFALLRNHNVLDKNNQPYQTYIDRGYFRVIESSFVDKYLTTHINLKTVVYQKGVDFINRLLEKEVANG